MFNPRSSGKPNDAFYGNFKPQFGGHMSATDMTAVTTIPATIQGLSAIAPIATEGPQATNGFHEHNATPRSYADPLKFGPGLFDGQPLMASNYVFYNTTPGGNNTIFNPQAGDLHTPATTLALGLGTPLSMQNADNTILEGLPPSLQTLHPNELHHLAVSVYEQPLAMTTQPVLQPNGHHFQQAQAFQAPPFVTDTSFEAIEQDDAESASVDSDASEGEKVAPKKEKKGGGLPKSNIVITKPPMPVSDDVRFLSTLKMHTAMMHENDPAMSYLNKVQIYTINIQDRQAIFPLAPNTQYRTAVRLGFETADKRVNPAHFWSLWKTNRGANDAITRGTFMLQAVEYVEPRAPKSGGAAAATTSSIIDNGTRAKIVLESAVFDSFSIIWTPGPNCTVAEVNIPIRFHVLSTDFSHSKGVKGIPLRLCAKTSLMSAEQSSSTGVAPPVVDATTTEMWYCQVKLFRDHGAERKENNDKESGEKAVAKAEDMLEQSKHEDWKPKRMSTKDRVATGRVTKSSPKQQQLPRRNSGASLPSDTESPEKKEALLAIQKELNRKLLKAHEYMVSQRTESRLYLAGEEHDDPDRYPVPLEQRIIPCYINAANSNPAVAHGGQGGFKNGPTLTEEAVRIYNANAANNMASWINAFGVDHTYRPSTQQPWRPAACIYVLYRDPLAPPQQNHHAIYLAQRTLKDLVVRVAAKFGLDASRVARCVRPIVRDGNEIEVLMDDEVAGQIPESAVMNLTVEHISGTGVADVGREWDMVLDSAEDTEPAPNADGSRLGAETLVDDDMIFYFTY